MSGLQEPVVTGCHFLLGGGTGQQITGQLLTGELIEGHVFVEGIDHPVPVG